MRIKVGRVFQVSFVYKTNKTLSTLGFIDYTSKLGHCQIHVNSIIEKGLLLG